MWSTEWLNIASSRAKHANAHPVIVLLWGYGVCTWNKSVMHWDIYYSISSSTLLGKCIFLLRVSSDNSSSTRWQYLMNKWCWCRMTDKIRVKLEVLAALKMLFGLLFVCLWFGGFFNWKEKQQKLHSKLQPNFTIHSYNHEICTMALLYHSEIFW